MNMDMIRLLSALPQFLVLLPSAASCYYTMKNQLRYTPLKTILLGMAVLLPYSLFCSCLCAMLQIDVNTVLLTSLILFFFPYRHTVTASLPKSLPSMWVSAPSRPFRHSSPIPLTLICTRHRVQRISPWKRLLSSLDYPALSQPPSRFPPVGIFTRWLTVWTRQKYGT